MTGAVWLLFLAALVAAGALLIRAATRPPRHPITLTHLRSLAEQRHAKE